MSIILARSLTVASRRTHFFKCRNLSSDTNQSVLATQSGIFRTLSESAPVEYLQKFVISVHDTTGLPWWATIVCTTIFLRSTVTVPLALYQHYILAKVRNIQLELAQLDKELKAELAHAVKLYQWDEKKAKARYTMSLKKQWNSLVIRDNCHPVKASLLLWFQIPLWVCFSTVLRNLAYKLPETFPNALTVHNELSTGGFAWIQDLTQIDPYFILPAAFGLINLGIIEMQLLSRTSTPSKLQRYVMNFFRGFTLIMVPITATVPSCLALYWTTSSAYGIFQNVILLSPKLKRMCRIPKTAVEIEKPYVNLFQNAKKRYSFSKAS